MKKIKSRMYQNLSLAALLLGSVSLASAQIADNNLNSFDSTAQLAPNGTPAGHSTGNGTTGGGIWYGTSIVDWDGTQDATGNGGGSAHITSKWGSDQANSDSPFEVYLGGIAWNMGGTPGLPISQYQNVQFDFRWDNSSTMTLDEFNNMSLVPTNYLNYGTTTNFLNAAGQLEVDLAKNYGDAAAIGGTNITSLATNQWVHYTFPINPSTAGEDGSIGILLRPRNYFSTSSHLTNDLVAKFWIDNVFLKGTAGPPPPPVVSIKPISPGLNFVQGSISGEFDRQNIRNLSTTANYGFSGLATAGNPVTYSFTINKWSAPDLTYHIFIDQVAGAGGASASDYNQPDVLIFQIGPNNGGTSIPNTMTAQITWKTNSPNSGTTGTAFSVTNLPISDLVGTWQLKFVSNTSGSVIPPDGTPLPFTIDSGLAANLANPVYVSFGLLPNANTPTLLGESIDIAQISITGGDSLSSITPGVYTDNFLTDSSLDITDKFSLNAHFNASLLFVPSNVNYQVAYTLPASGYVVQANSNLLNSSSWTILPGLATTILPPGMVSLIPNSSLPAGNNAFFRLLQLTATKLQVLLPGEVNAPGTVSGKTGTPAPISGGDSGALVNVTINAVDNNFNIVNRSDTIQLTTTDGQAIVPGNAPLVNGTLTETVDMDTGTWTITATDTSASPPLSPNTSSSFTVSP
jgi:hypothetical protein